MFAQNWKRNVQGNILGKFLMLHVWKAEVIMRKTAFLDTVRGLKQNNFIEMDHSWENQESFLQSTSSKYLGEK